MPGTAAHEVNAAAGTTAEVETIDHAAAQPRAHEATAAAGAAAVQRMNGPQPLRVEDVEDIFHEMSAAKFTDGKGREAPIPFHYPIDGCFDRAHMMVQLLIARGLSPEKVFAISMKKDGSSNLAPVSRFAADGKSRVEWWYHVAPILRAVQPDGKMVELVLDPSMSDGPLRIEQWTGLMNPDRFKRCTPAEIRALQGTSKKGYPYGRNIVYTATPHAYGPYSDPVTATREDADDEHAEKLEDMTMNAAIGARAHATAAHVRSVLATGDAEKMSFALTELTRDDRELLHDDFPKLEAAAHALAAGQGDA